MNYKYFTPEEMLSTIENHYNKLGYKTKLYSDDFFPARVPFYCSKENDEIVVEEIVVEIITANNISKEDFFPDEKIDNITLLEVSSVRFYQHYFIKAKIFYAYPDYAKEDDKLREFKTICKKIGIGLLKTSKDKIEIVAEARPLFDEICNQLQIQNENIRTKLEYHFRNFLHYFVYYPIAEFKRISISQRTEKRISLVLIDKLLELKNIKYSQKLIGLAYEYRKMGLDDYEIAEKYITTLWDQYLGIKYPTIQIRVENILQRNEKYREHFVHQFQVFLIGSYFLDKKYKEVSEKFYEQYGCEIETIWLAASTFHDFSYSLQNFEDWLIQYFEDTLIIKHDQTKEKINILNLDAAMIREELFNKLSEMIFQFKEILQDEQKQKLIRFFYEKVVSDRNHGVLSAISLLKLFDDNENNKINEKGILQAALAIGCHDEDIWEALCGCQGFIRSPHISENCIVPCTRKELLWPSKKSKIYKENPDAPPSNCEKWEKEVMYEKILNKIKFIDYPILFLLMFCDSIQDEGRVKHIEENNLPDNTHIDDIIIKQNKKVSINVKIKSVPEGNKSQEIERLAWCLEDSKFKININDIDYLMNGRGG